MHRLPYPGSLRRSPHGSGRSAPSRAASLSWLASASVEACPLDRALCRPLRLRASRSEPPREVDLISPHQSSLCPSVHPACTAGRITTGPSRAVLRPGAIAGSGTRGGYAAGAWCPAASAASTFPSPTGRSRSIGSSAGSGASRRSRFFPGAPVPGRRCVRTVRARPRLSIALQDREPTSAAPAKLLLSTAIRVCAAFPISRSPAHSGRGAAV
jgi:hypothetical protein